MSATEVKSTGDVDNALKFIFESQQKTFWESANLLAKGMAFYLAITAGLVGYALTRELPMPLPRLTLSIATGTSLLFSVVTGICFWGLIGILSFLEGSVRRVSPELFQEMNLHQFFARWRTVVWIGVICTSQAHS